MEPELTSGEAPINPAITGRRAAPRLRLGIPARFVSIYSTQRCILLDLSRTGARVALASPLAVGQPGYLEIERMEIFGTIARAEHGSDLATNALMFDEPLTRDAVLLIRAYAEQLEHRNHLDLREQVRRWVTGEV